MNFIIGGIKGLATTISVKKKEPSQDIRQKLKVPENDLCVDDFNCALQDTILLQGNLYIYNTMVCFHSVFNKHSIVGNDGTLVTIPYSQLIEIQKKKKLIFDNSIQLTTVNGSYFFTSFLSRNKAIKIISEYFQMYQKMLPKPSYPLQGSIYLQQNDLNSIDNEDEWLKQAILSIQNLEQGNNQNQYPQQQSFQNPQQQSIQNQSNNNQYQDIPQHMISSRIGDSSSNRIIQSNQINQNQQLNLNNIIKNNNINSNNNQLLLYSQFSQKDKNLDNQCNIRVENNSSKLQWQIQKDINQDSQPKQQEQIQNQQEIVFEERKMQVIQEQNRNNQIEQIEIEKQYQEQNKRVEEEENIDPLLLQKSVIKEFEDNFNIYKPLFEVRSQKINSKISKEFSQAEFQEAVITKMSAREFFGIFFSNQIYTSSYLNKKFNCFFEFYIQEYLNGTNLTISEIQPPPPEIYNSIYSNNYLQLLEYPDYSEKHISFVHPIPKPSAFLPKSLQCQMRENIYWNSPQSFILIRYLTLKGMPMSSSFEPRVIYYIDEIGEDVRIKSGFYVHFKSSSMFKKLIQKSSKEENDKTWNQLKNLLLNVSEEYKKKRDENKLIVQQQNEEFLKQFNINEFEQYDETDLEENQNQIPLQQNIYQKNQKPNVQAEQQQIYEQELGRVASQASNQACNIF